MYNMLHNFCCHCVIVQTAQRTSTDSALGPDLFSGYSETASLNPTSYKVYKNHTRPLKMQYKSLWPTRQSYTEELIRPLITGSTVLWYLEIFTQTDNFMIGPRPIISQAWLENIKIDVLQFYMHSKSELLLIQMYQF